MRDPSRPARRRILAISSGGGHWIELLRLLPAFEGHAVTFATTHGGYRQQVPGHRFHAIPDATRENRLKVVWVAATVLFLLLRVRPDVVISTGAAPGYLALRFAKALGARTVWLDSLANAAELSLSGQKAGRSADLWLTQWEHLAQPSGPRCEGAVV